MAKTIRLAERCAPQWAWDQNKVAYADGVGAGGRCVAHVWDGGVVQKSYLDMLTAFGKRYNAHAPVEGIFITGENSINWVNPGGNAATMWNSCCNTQEPKDSSGHTTSYRSTHQSWLRYSVDSTFSAANYIAEIKARGGPKNTYSNSCPSNVTNTGHSCKTGGTP